MLYHTNTTGPSVQDFQTAFAKSIGVTIETESNQVLLLVHGKTNLHGIISEAIGGIANRLDKNGFTDLNGVKVYLETERIKSPFSSGVILAAHVSEKLLNKALADRRATDVVYVPWAPEELNQYLKLNKSVEL